MAHNKEVSTHNKKKIRKASSNNKRNQFPALQEQAQ